MARLKTLADAKVEFIDSSPQAQKLWLETAPRRALSAMLVEARMRAGLSQSDLAAIAGWDKGYVSRLESATDGFPSVQTLKKYLAGCGETLGISTFREEAEGRPEAMGSVLLSAEGARTVTPTSTGAAPLRPAGRE